VTTQPVKTQLTPAGVAIAEIRQHLAGFNGFLTGSCVAADDHGMPLAWSDIDVFMPTSHTLVAGAQHLLNQGYKLDDRFSRVWERWLNYGFKSWHTNSLRLHSPGGVETNLVYKLTEGHAATSLAEVIESFDFGLLCTGYELKDFTYRTMRSYLFPTHNPNGPLPMMPSKRTNWRNGFISQYNGLREFGRYAKYHTYGYDMSLVKDDLAEGYRAAELYLSDHFDEEKQKMGEIYGTIADKIEDDAIDELHEATKKLDYKDSLDQIMEALE
jgi:hypothetical protein